MRLLIVTHVPLRADLGAGQVAANLATALRGRGHEVVTWSPPPAPDGYGWRRTHAWRRQSLRELLRRSGGFDAIDLPAVAITRDLTRTAKLVARSTQPELRYLALEMATELVRLPRSPLRVGLGLLRSLVLGGRVLAGWHQAPVILCLGSHEEAWMRRRLPWLSPRLRSYVHAPSASEQETLARVRNARRPAPGPGIRFLWIGRWSSHKDTPRLVRFISERLARRPDDSLTVAGCGSEAERSLPRELLDRSRVRLLPGFTRSELGDLLLRHDAGLFTSRVEGWGLSLNEMLESGMPVFATETGAVEDLRPYFGQGLRRFPPPPDLGPAELPLAAPGPGYYRRFSWGAIAARYEEEVLAAGATPEAA